MLSRVARNRAVLTAAARATAAAPRTVGAKTRMAPMMHQASRNFCAASTTGGATEERMEFKAEAKKLLDIVAKSLYTDKEVFVRELISNSSDALEKLRFFQATGKINAVRDDGTPLELKVAMDKDARTFTITDTGIGMTKEEMIENLGTIARSGSLEFLNKEGETAGTDIIGQFGVGFYSSFVVADRVQVFSRPADATKAGNGYLWESDGDGSFTIKEMEDLPRGTKIVLHLRAECGEFCEETNVKNCVKKFSSFVNFPIKMMDKDVEVDVAKQEALWLKLKKNLERFSGI